MASLENPVFIFEQEDDEDNEQEEEENDIYNNNEEINSVTNDFVNRQNRFSTQRYDSDEEEENGSNNLLRNSGYVPSKKLTLFGDEIKEKIELIEVNTGDDDPVMNRKNSGNENPNEDPVINRKSSMNANEKRTIFWLPDSQCNMCCTSDCKTKLRLRNRHHCRWCGLLYCTKCCNKKKKHPLYENNFKLCCNSCMNGDTNVIEIKEGIILRGECINIKYKKVSPNTTLHFMENLNELTEKEKDNQKEKLEKLKYSKTKEYDCILRTNSLLILPQENLKSYKPVYWIPLKNHLEIIELEDDPTSCSFLVQNFDFSFLFKFSLNSFASEWQHCLEGQIDLLNNKHNSNDDINVHVKYNNIN
eukprot:TRINITY_DN1673_c1_g2_i1.p1 TRINITY_DN1673_c1_g2~~TRINITY_DN1673_c1_g2_i1.p1  ORF type:complete len:360 (+),score=84.13 TRINITY_DN1673_c1_g2_i1:143-1222(+)